MFKMNAILPLLFGGGSVAVIAVIGAVVAAVNGQLSPIGIGVVATIVAAFVGAVALYFVKQSQQSKRLKNRVPGFGLCFDGAGNVHTVDDHSRFLSDFVIEWRARIEPEAEVLKTIEQLDVEWRPGETFKEGTMEVRGVTRSADFVIVSVRPGRTIGATALPHEIVHAHLLRTTGDADPGHKKFGKFDQLIEAMRVH